MNRNDLNNSIISKIYTNTTEDITGDELQIILRDLNDNLLNRNGDNMLGYLTLVGAPTIDLHAVTKKYVDDLLATKEDSINKSLSIITDSTSNIKYPSVKAVFDWATGLFVVKNTAITGATKTKITYDSKGLVTAGADLTDADLPTGINANKIADGSISNSEFQFLDGVTSNIQTQLNAKGTVSNVDVVGGTGITVSGSPITTSGTITVTNTAPDQTVVLNSGTGIGVAGTYPNFTLTNTAPDQTVVLTNGTGIGVSGTYPSFTIQNTAPDQTVSLSNGTGISITGTYPNFTITNTQPSSGGTVTSVGLTMPTAFSVANSPIIGAGTLNVTANGLASQYIRGDGTLADMPTGGGGGGSSVNYYLNGSINQGTFGGNTYYQMSRNAINGTGVDFPISTNGFVARFITDANDPAQISIPSGNWNLEFFFSSSSNGGTPSFYANIYKVSGTTFTLIGTNSTAPEGITNGTLIDTYFTNVSIPTASLLVTDRIAIDIYVNHSGRTITLHTQNGHLSEIVTTFSTGLSALNGLTRPVQYFQTGTAGTDFTIDSLIDTHTFNIPTASATKRGLLSTGDWSSFNGKADDSLVLHKAGAERITGVKTIEGVNLNFDLGSGSPKFSFQQQGGFGGYNTLNILKDNGSVIFELEQIGTLKLPYYSTSGFAKFLSTGELTVDTNTYITSAITSLNGLTGATQTFANGTSGNSPAFTSIGTIHTLNIPNASTGGVTAGLISKTQYDTFNGKIGGSGSVSYVPRFDTTGTITTGLIQDNGSTVGIGGLTSTVQFYLTTTKLNGIYGYTNYTTDDLESSGVYGQSLGARASGFNVGVYGFAGNSSTMNIGVKGSASTSAGLSVGADFSASGGTPYSLRLRDGTQGAGKFLKSITSDGYANWANIQASDITGLSGYVTGSGTLNKVAKFSGTNSLTNSLIEDDGSTLAINSNLDSNVKFNVATTNTESTAKFVNSRRTGFPQGGNNYTVYSYNNSNKYDANYGFYSDVSTIGIIQGYGVYGSVVNTTTGGNPSAIAVGGVFKAVNGGNGGAYSVQLQDGTQGAGKFLKSIDLDGNANWSQITKTDITNGISGSGIANRVSKWSDSSTLTSGLIQDDGTSVSIGDVPNAVVQLYVRNFDKDFTGVFQNEYPAGDCYGFIGQSLPSSSTFETIGIKGEAEGSTLRNTGIQGFANTSTTGRNLGGFFQATGGAQNHSLLLQDGTQGANKFLLCTDSNGYANWATITNSYIYGGGSNGQVLTSNGAGVSSWQTPTGGGGGTGVYELLYLSNNC